MADLKTRAAALLASADRMTPGPWRPAGADADVIRSTDNRCREIVAANLRIDNTVGIVALRNGAPSLIGDLLAEIEKITAPCDAEGPVGALTSAWQCEMGFPSSASGERSIDAARTALVEHLRAQAAEVARLTAKVARLRAALEEACDGWEDQCAMTVCPTVARLRSIATEEVLDRGEP